MSGEAGPEVAGRTRMTAALFLLLNLVVKLALVPLNRAEYTDGILQLMVFETRAGLYPPLYGALAWAVAFSGLDLEWSGRAVSAMAGAAAVIPVYAMTRRLSGETAARLAALFFTLSPLVLRWSERVMTDSLFLCLSATTLWLALEGWLALKPRRGGPEQSPSDFRQSDRFLAAAMAAAVLAGLTRYQGVLLVVPLALPLGDLLVRRVFPWRTALVSVAWILLPLWTLYGGFAHGGQFSDRTAGTPLSTGLAYWNTAESFVLLAPYYFGYPVAALALVGLAVGKRNNRFLLLYGVWAAVLLVLQSAFGSFQYRYLLPVLPALLVLAGEGGAWLEAVPRTRLQRLLASGVILASVVYLTLFSCAVLVLQREAFGDQRAAAEWIRAQAPPGTPVFSNERYGNFLQLGSVKLSFWAGRPVELLWRPSLIAGQPPVMKDLSPGAFLALSNAYGGNEAVGQLFQELSSKYRLRPVTAEPFTATVVPLLDDVMVDPMFNQNPLAWVVRYVPQHFQTRVFQVDGPAN